jgi:hypothetical protein
MGHARTAFEVLAACLGAGVIAALLFLVVATVLAGFAGVELTHAVFGSGPRVFGKKVGPTLFELRAAPIQSWIKAVGHDPYEDEAELERARRAMRPGRVTWTEASPIRRVLVFVVAPRLAVFALAAIAIGPRRASLAAVRGVEQLVTGALGPLSTARTILEGGAAALVEEGALVLLGLALAKWVAWSLLVLPTDLAGAIDRGGASKTVAKVRGVMLVASIPFGIVWLVAWIAWLAA